MAMNPNNNNLPEDIILDIFARVPAKSIGKFRCLSKPWRALLTSPSFIKSHLTHQTQTHQQNLILISSSGALRTISAIRDDGGTVSNKFHLSNTWRAVVGSCNGLVLLQNKQKKTFLVNPVTQEQVQVPEQPPEREEGTTKLLGFGYDCVSDDYKIVSLSYYTTNVEYRYDTFVDVYSLKLGVWRRLDSRPPYHHLLKLGVFFKGAIHSLTMCGEPDATTVITAFDLCREEFYEIPPPIDMKKHKFNNLFVLEGCLCMMNNSPGVEDIWMLKEYNKLESWTKFRIYYRDEWITKPLCFIGVEQVVLISEAGTFVSEKNTLVVYNFKDRSFTNMAVDGVSAMFADGETFTESLLSPDFNNHIRGGNIS